ncbi:MAG: hypothetical protein U1F43_21695 [Myxococcota bacterium]
MTWPHLFQALCVVVLAAAYALHLRQVAPEERRAALVDIALVALGAWLAEETSIVRYRVYGYPDWWWLKLDEVPILIVAIWPMVVLSARAVVSGLFPAAVGVRRALLVGLVVAVDASLVEVLAVRAGLWSWTLGGYLGVPIIGILGWSFYAAGMSWALDASTRSRLPRWATPLVALAITHALLVAAWWALFKWVSVPLPLLSVYLFALAAFAGTFALLARPTRRIALAVAVPRVLAASVFVLLLVVRTAESGELDSFHWLHLAAVALLYVTAVRWR